MADDEQLLIAVKAQIDDATRNFDLITRTATDRFSQMERRSQQFSQRFREDARSSTALANAEFAKIGNGLDFGALARNALGITSGILGLDKIRSAADEWTSFGNKLKAVGEEETRVGDRLSQLSDIALNSRSSLDSIASLYVSLRRASEELGANNAQVARVTETVSKALANSGATAQETSSAILQLGQALGSGTLQGDELRSLLENAPTLAKIIAKEFGVAIGELKSLGSEGKLTSDKVFAAILKGSADVDAAFAKTVPTIGQSLTNLGTAATRYAGQLDQANGISKTVAEGINSVAQNADIALPIIASLGVALTTGFAGGGPYGAGIAGTATALVLLGDQIKPIAGELGTLGDYARVAFDMIKQSSADATKALGPDFQSAIDQMTAALSGVSGPVENLGQIVKSILNGIIGAFEKAALLIASTWNGLGASLGEIIVNSMNGVIATIEAAINKIISAVNSLGSGVNALGGKVGVDIGIGKIGDVNLGRVASDYAGAGAALGKAYGEAFDRETRDYVGDAFKTIDSSIQKVRAKANELGEDRAEQARRNSALRAEQRKSDGSLDQKLKPPKAKEDDASGGKGGAAKANEFDKATEAVEKRIRALQIEQEVLGKSSAEAARYKTTLELTDAAKKAGLEITDEMKAKIDNLASAYSNAKVSLENAQKAQQDFIQLQQFAGTSLSSFFSDLVSGGKNASDALMNLTKRLSDAAIQALLLGQGPLASLFGTASSEKGGVGGIIGALFKGVGFGGNAGLSVGATTGGLYAASGGYIRGPGSTTSDSIPAMLSDREFVVNADATAKHIDLLHAINSGKLPGFADGGLVSPIASPQGTLGTVNRTSSQIISIAPSITVNASGGEPAQNNDLAKKIGESVRSELRGMMSDEIRNQLRPGNVLNPV